MGKSWFGSVQKLFLDFLAEVRRQEVVCSGIEQHTERRQEIFLIMGFRVTSEGHFKPSKNWIRWNDNKLQVSI